MADASALGADAARHEGSNPSLPTNRKLSGFSRVKTWAARSADQAVCADESCPLGALARTSRLPRRRFESNKVRQAIFLFKRLLSSAILGRFSASFIHSSIGSSQPVRFCSRFNICSSSDFFSERSLAFSMRYISCSISCSKYPSRSRWSLIEMALILSWLS